MIVEPDQNELKFTYVAEFLPAVPMAIAELLGDRLDVEHRAKRQVHEIGFVHAVVDVHAGTIRATSPAVIRGSRELNVDAIIEGMVVQSGERVRITAQLIRASDDRQLRRDLLSRAPL
jgi:hypothetical protein